MIFNYVSKEYPGVQPRPRSELTCFEDEKLILAATSWGSNAAAEVLQQTIKDKFTLNNETQATAASADIFSSAHNSHKLKSVIIEANSAIIEKVNKSSYQSTCEAILLNYVDNVISWIQIGQPSLLLLRDNKVVILEASHDLSLDYMQNESLPSAYLGIETAIGINVKTLIVKPNDIFVFYAGRNIPSSFLNIKKYKTKLDELSQQLHECAVKENKDNSFWISCFSI